MTTVADIRARRALQRQIDRLTAERDQARGIAVALEQQVAAVAALHVDARHALAGPYCKDCMQDWPCPTRRALDGEP